MDERERLHGITERIIGAAMVVHTAIGPGLIESAYEVCLAYELADRGMYVEQQKPLPLTYRAVQLECGYRLDWWLSRPSSSRSRPSSPSHRYTRRSSSPI